MTAGSGTSTVSRPPSTSRTAWADVLSADSVSFEMNVRVVVGGLLAHEDERRLLLLDDLDEDAGHDGRIRPLGLDEDRTVRAHRERGPELLLGLGRPDGDHDHLDAALGFLDPQRFLDGDLVERIDDPFQAGLDDAGALGVHLDGGFVVRHALGGDQNLHAFQPPSELWFSARRRSRRVRNGTAFVLWNPRRVPREMR
jgi:hypothetical protein